MKPEYSVLVELLVAEGERHYGQPTVAFRTEDVWAALDRVEVEKRRYEGSGVAVTCVVHARKKAEG